VEYAYGVKALEECWYESYSPSPSPRLEGDRDIALVPAARAQAQGASSRTNTKPNNHPTTCCDASLVST
jgi:hypothetical protein